MKKLLTMAFLLYGLTVSAQIPLNTNPRTPITGQPIRVIWDKYLRAGSFFWLPYTNSTTPSLNGVIDSVGGGFQLLSNGRLSISKGLSTGFFQYYNTDQVDALVSSGGAVTSVFGRNGVIVAQVGDYSSFYAPLTLGTGYIQNGTGLQSTSNFNISGSGQFGGKVSIGSASLASGNVISLLPLTGGTNAFNYLSNPIIQSGVTSTAKGFRSVLNSIAATYTTSDWYHFSAEQGTIGAGNTVTRQTGFYIDASLSGASTNYGVWGNIGAAATNWNIYASGTAKNYFNGNTIVGISNTDNGQKLQVVGRIRVSQGLAGVAGTDSLVAHDNTSKELKLISPSYYVPTSRTLTAGYGINTIGDLSANRTVSADTTSAGGLVSKSRLTASLASYVTLNTSQSINASKTFASGLISTNVFSPSVTNTSSSNNSQINLTNTGTSISNNKTGTENTLTIDNIDVTNTGKILNANSAGSTVFSIDKLGNASTSTAPTLGSHLANKTYVDNASTIQPIAVKTADYALTATDYTIVTGTSGTTYTLPAANSVPVGKTYVIKNFSSGSITIATTGTELKWNAATFLVPVSSVTATITGWILQTDGTWWYLVIGT